MSREHAPYSTVIKPAFSDFEIECFAEGRSGECLNMDIKTPENFQGMRLQISGMATLHITSEGVVAPERDCSLGDLLFKHGATKPSLKIGTHSTGENRELVMRHDPE